MQNLGAVISANARALILSFLTIGLLCLYAWATFSMVQAALSCNVHQIDCSVTQRLSSLTTTLQSLVSAVVVTVLAISPAKGPLNLRPFGVSPESNLQSPVATILALFYVFAWFFVGATALIVGAIVLSDPTAKIFSDLVSVGQSWLGLAIGAVYAYFGVDRSG
ncbi:MAG: hypothetical protein AB1704_30070 [Pseudomonadota bacterium]|jgi:hypothetical protein|uniref:hypothetical protein n=1 Tax=Burkholderiaceae TaxID=119060 RepID=UPI0010F432ED|nr:hypothetical protein [Burkholderia sp. 4M9327F10]